MRKAGFTLIELMVAMVIGLAAVTSVYALGSAMSRQFFVEQRVAVSQGASRVATLELRQDISRAGLFGSPNAYLRAGDPGVERVDPTCDANRAELPLLGGGNGPLGAFQYYANQDIAVLDPDSANAAAVADRLRVLTSLYLTEQLLINSTDVNGTMVVLQSGNQAYRRTFGWGSTAGPFTSGQAPDYLAGALDWQTAWGNETGSWKGIGMRGARAFQSGSVLHFVSPEGRHFFRSVFGKGPNVQNQIRLQITPALPIGTACLPGAAEGSTVAPLQWVEYAIIDPDNPADGSNADDFIAFDQIFFGDLSDPDSPAQDLFPLTEGDLLESPNRILVRRILDANTGAVQPNSTQVIAEFVSHFEVSFVIDSRSGETSAGIDPDHNLLTGTSAQTAVNGNPERVRSVIIDLGIRNPLEDPNLDFNGEATRFDVDVNARGAARVRHLHIEVPVMSVARRNLG